MIKIALDIDDVIAAFTPHAHTFHNVLLEGPVNYWCPETMKERLGEGWFQDKIRPNKEFWETIPVLSDPILINVNVACYISSFPVEMFAVRLEWLRKHGFPSAPLIATDNKLEACVKLGITHLVDDKPQTIEALKETSTKGIHFITPYCGFQPVGDKVITNLNQINQHI